MRRLALLVTAIALAGCAGASGPREVRVSVTEKGFEPAKLEIAKGTETTLIITRKTDKTCATAAVFIETGRRYELPLNEEVRVQLPTDSPVTLHYACGMDMIRGEIVVK